MRTILALVLLLPSLAFPQGNRRPAQQREVKIQKTSLSRDQEIQLGKEAAGEVERTLEVVKSPEVEAWLNNIGQKLAKQPQANAYPYYFKLVNDESINAFALPGGPMFVHTGLIRAADNEAEVAGVLAHEMSHVALRHGASQMSKAQTWQTIGGLIGAVAGMATGGETCTLLCQAMQAGGGLLSNSVLMKFSRDMERDADLNGARMMASAGYSPIELANFFEKLEKQTGSAGQPKGLAAWFSSHPSPGNRVEYVSQDTTFYPKKDYTASTGNFARVKQLAAAIPPPKPQPGALLAAKPNAQARQNLPAGFKDVQTVGFAIGCPSDWQAGQAQSGGSVIVAPQGGAKKGQNGGVELILGGMADYYKPQGNAELQASTNELVAAMKKGDSAMQVAAPTRIEIGGQPALMTRLTTKTSDGQDQVVYFYTAVRDSLLWNLALAAPSSQLSNAEPVFRQIAGTVQFFSK